MRHLSIGRGVRIIDEQTVGRVVNVFYQSGDTPRYTVQYPSRSRYNLGLAVTGTWHRDGLKPLPHTFSTFHELKKWAKR